MMVQGNPGTQENVEGGFVVTDGPGLAAAMCSSIPNLGVSPYISSDNCSPGIPG